MHLRCQRPALGAKTVPSARGKRQAVAYTSASRRPLEMATDEQLKTERCAVAEALPWQRGPSRTGSPKMLLARGDGSGGTSEKTAVVAQILLPCEKERRHRYWRLFLWGVLRGKLKDFLTFWAQTKTSHSEKRRQVERNMTALAPSRYISFASRFMACLLRY